MQLINRAFENFLEGNGRWHFDAPDVDVFHILNSSLNGNLHEPIFKLNTLNRITIILRSYFMSFSITTNIDNSMQAIVNSQMKWSKFSDIQGN